MTLKARYADLEQAFFKGNHFKTNDDEDSICVDIKYIKPVELMEKGLYRHYFLIYFDEEFISQVAGYLGFNIYNLKMKYNTTYHHDKQDEYLNLRDFHKH